MTRIVFSLVACVLSGLPALAQEKETAANPWFADYDQAVLAAKEAKKDLFVDFTGSDWCGWCVRLHKEVFETPEFLAEVSKSYILVALDFPRGEEVKAKVPNPARNSELQAKYQIGGFPSILLMSVDGEVFAKTGYQPGGAEKYLPHLKEIAATGKTALAEVKKIKADFDAAKDGAKDAIIVRAAEKLEAVGDNGAGIETLVPIVKTAVTVDADNKKGIRVKALKALLKSGKADDEDSTAAKSLDAKNAGGLLELVVLGQMRQVDSKEKCEEAIKAITEVDGFGIKDGKVGALLFATAASWNVQALKDTEAAKKFAKKCLDLNPEDENMLKFVKGILDG